MFNQQWIFRWDFFLVSAKDVKVWAALHSAKWPLSVLIKKTHLQHPNLVQLSEEQNDRPILELKWYKDSLQLMIQLGSSD